MTLEPIATVSSCFGGKFAVPRQPGLCPAAWGRVIFHPPFRSAEAVRGLDGFSHIWLIFGFHQTAAQGWKPTVRPPRLGGNKRIGVFASRSTFRPNALGLSLVRLEGIDTAAPESPVLLIGGHDLVEGTSIFDIKPYLPYAEALPDATGGFANEPPARFPVETSPAAAADFAALPVRARQLICEALSLDPRPPAGATDPARIYGATLCGCEVRFTFCAGICRVESVQPTSFGSEIAEKLH